MYMITLILAHAERGDLPFSLLQIFLFPTLSSVTVCAMHCAGSLEHGTILVS